MAPKGHMLGGLVVWTQGEHVVSVGFTCVPLPDHGVDSGTFVSSRGVGRAAAESLIAAWTLYTEPRHSGTGVTSTRLYVFLTVSLVAGLSAGTPVAASDAKARRVSVEERELALVAHAGLGDEQQVCPLSKETGALSN
jgi:hypothetical protein